MGFIKQYCILSKQCRSAHRDMKKKQDAITCVVYEVDVQSCIKNIPVYSVGIGNNAIEVKVDNCGMFNNEYCINSNCEMCHKNHEYIDARNSYKFARAARRQFVKDVFKCEKLDNFRKAKKKARSLQAEFDNQEKHFGCLNNNNLVCAGNPCDTNGGGLPRCKKYDLTVHCPRHDCPHYDWNTQHYSAYIKLCNAKMDVFLAFINLFTLKRYK